MSHSVEITSSMYVKIFLGINGLYQPTFFTFHFQNFKYCKCMYKTVINVCYGIFVKPFIAWVQLDQSQNWKTILS